MTRITNSSKNAISDIKIDLCSIDNNTNTYFDWQRYKYLCPLPIKFIKDDNYNDIKTKYPNLIFKATAYYDTLNNAIVFKFIGTSKEVFDKLIETSQDKGQEIKNNVFKVLTCLLRDRLQSDVLLREKLEKISNIKISLSEITTQLQEDKNKLIELNYSDREIDDLLSNVETTNTYIGVKDAELTISQSTTALEKTLTSYKKSGVRKVIIKKGNDINIRVKDGTIKANVMEVEK